MRGRQPTLLLAAFLALACASARAEDSPPAPPAAPVRPEMRALDDAATQLKKEVDDLDATIEADTKALQALSSASATQKTLAELQGKIGSLLAKLADNGPLKQLSDKIIADDKAAMDVIGKRNYDAALRQKNQEALAKSIDETERLVKGITDMRRELTGQLNAIRNNQEYLEDSIKVGQAAQMTDVLRDLLGKMRAASDRLKSIMSTVPGV